LRPAAVAGHIYWRQVLQQGWARFLRESTHDYDSLLVKCVLIPLSKLNSVNPVNPGNGVMSLVRLLIAAAERRVWQLLACAKPCCYTWPACRYLCCPAWQLVDCMHIDLFSCKAASVFTI